VKTTGLVVLMIGIAVSLFCGIALLVNEPIESSGTMNAGMIAARGPNLIVPLGVAIGAIVVGTYMLMYGGRGYYITANPNVRN
jgi:hypothetical protein